MAHPFCDPSFHIQWSQLTPDNIVADITAALADADDRLDKLARVDRGRMTFEDVFVGLERATEPLSEAWGKVTHLDSVCNSDALREAQNEMLPKVTEFWTNLYLNESLWDLFKTFANTEEAAQLQGIQKRFMEETLTDFRNSGADLPPNEKERLAEIEKDLAATTQKFSENVLDSTNAWEKIITSETDLAGLPQTIKDAAREAAQQKDPDSKDTPAWRFTLQAPSLLPVMEHLESDAIRKEFWEAANTIGNQGDHDNTDLIWKILTLRQEKAELLGHSHFADHILARRMAKDGKTALHFVEDLHRRVKKNFNRECTQLQEYKAEATAAPTDLLQPWETAYWAEKRRQHLYDFDDEELRPYFPIDPVLAGMFRIAEKLFDIRITQRETTYTEPGSPAPTDGKIEVWHPEVKFYEIHTPDDIHLGSFYADWHPRETKRAGAWMNYLKTGRPPTDDEDRQPHLGLICGNMSPAVGDKPALLKHEEVETVFHEFGHLLHHLLGDVEIKSLNGVQVAWDFVELPSQFMENFCWDRESLDFFARHYETGDPIPAKLLKKMTAARNYHSATAMMRQLSLGKLDLELHINHAPKQQDTVQAKNLDELSRELLEGYVPPLATPTITIARRFSHLFASPTGYAAGYYSYKWAEVLDADAFTRFQKEGVLNAKTGRDFREKILSKGNSEDPAKLFHDFMNRPPDLTALLTRSALN